MIKGYYSIIQYCPDLARLEAANIGVILFCPEPRFIRAKTSAGNDRIRRFFGAESQDWERIAVIKSSVEKRLAVDAEAFRTLEDLERFRLSRANDIQLTPPRSLLLDDPVAELDRLFEDLVGGRTKKPTRDTAAPIKRKLESEFKRADVERFLRENLSVEVPAFQCKIEVPYGYQNGRFNLLQPVKFEQATKEGVITNACRYAVEGRSLYTHRDPQFGNLQLNIVASFAAGAREYCETVHEILGENDVKFYTDEEIPALVQEIRDTARELPADNLLEENQ